VRGSDAYFGLDRKERTFYGPPPLTAIGRDWEMGRDGVRLVRGCHPSGAKP
jgi:hypothetical protein